MATIRRKVPETSTVEGEPEKPVSKLEALRAKRAAISSLKLSTDLSEPITEVTNATWLIHGERKIGKTSLASRFPDAVFMMFEPGGKGLRIRNNPVPTWDVFLEYVRQILKSDLKTVVIDTGSIAYDRCLDYTCAKAGVTHPSDGAHGAVWDSIKKEFQTPINQLILGGKGVVFTAHSTVQQFQKRTGGEYSKIVPDMSKQARVLMAGIADVTAYYGYYGEHRYMTIEGSDELEAGHRLAENFWVKDEFTILEDDLGRPVYSGNRVHSIWMGNHESEGYENILTAFRNQQTDDGRPERKVSLSDQPKKRSK